MTITGFLSYVEIKTKITSLFAFLLALAYLYYEGAAIAPLASGVFFASLFLLDLATTAINNYIDTKTNHQTLTVERGFGLLVIYLLLAASALLGLWLVLLTDILVLFIGILGFLCGIFYTFGPFPISRQPLGELLSGIFYGFFVPFLLFYINLPDGGFLSLRLSLGLVSLSVVPLAALKLLLLSAAPFCATANIMLANNICDRERDISVGRYTLPFFLGKRALTLFRWLYLAVYAAVGLMLLLGLLPAVCVLFFLTLPVVLRNIRAFEQKQEKESTFMLAIANYVIIMASLTLLVFAGGLGARLVF